MVRCVKRCYRFKEENSDGKEGGACEGGFFEELPGGSGGNGLVGLDFAAIAVACRGGITDCEKMMHPTSSGWGQFLA